MIKLPDNGNILVLVESVVQGIVDGGSEDVVLAVQDGVESIRAAGDLVEGDVEAIGCEEPKLICNRISRGQSAKVPSVSI